MTTASSQLPDTPQRGDEPMTWIRSSTGRPTLNLRDLWRYRELGYFLIWRDVKVRYKQTVLGVAWAIIQPLASMLVFALFFGRLANFINDELWGRATDVPWAMIFPRGGPVPRHPSQLYEAALEGVVLFVLLQIALRLFGAHRRPGLISALFFAGYGTFRFICEFFREPDTQFIGPVSMGMALSIPVWLGAGVLFWIAYSSNSKPA